MELLKEVIELQSLMDDETFNHCNNVKNAAVNIGSELGLDEERLGNACALLDIGKLLINEFIFHKAEQLSEVERELMNLHSYLGYKICLENNVPEDIAEIILYHHGKCIPYLSQVPEYTEETKKYAEVIHTIDVYEALTEERGYRSSHTKDEAYVIMEETAEAENYHMNVVNLLYEMN